jgi:hypothetical protein
LKWVEIIESRGHLNVTKQELETAPEGTLFPIKFCADTSNITDDSKWVLGILLKTTNNTVFELRNLIQVESKKCHLQLDGDNGLSDMWGLYYRNPIWPDVSNVITGLGVDANLLLDKVRLNDDTDESYEVSLSDDDADESFTNEPVDISTDDVYKGVLDVPVCEFTMIDSQGHSRCEHKEYQKMVRNGTIFVLNYWYPLGFNGYSELYLLLYSFEIHILFNFFYSRSCNPYRHHVGGFSIAW